MNIKITGKELKATDAIKNYIDTKAERIEKYFDTEDLNLFVTIKKEGGDQVAEMQISVNGESFRAVTASNDLYASIDKDIDILEGQIRKMKTKKDKQNMTESIRAKEASRAEEHEIEDEIVKIIESMGLKVITRNRKIIKPYELDIYIPELNKAIEFNGTYWHYSEKHFIPGKHGLKSKLCRQKGIKLLHVREDLWLINKEKMKNIIKNFLNL